VFPIAVEDVSGTAKNGLVKCVESLDQSVGSALTALNPGKSPRYYAPNASCLVIVDRAQATADFITAARKIHRVRLGLCLLTQSRLAIQARRLGSKSTTDHEAK